MFCPPGAQWTYKHKGAIAGIDGYVEYKYSGNVLIGSTSCQQITGTFKGWHIGWSYLNTNTVIPNVKTYYTYQANNVVYLYNGSTFDTVVNFNAAIGDKWLELRYPGNAQCTNARSHYLVTDTNRVVINNFSLKRITTTCVYTATSVTTGTTVTTYTRNNVFIERLLMQGSTLGNIADLFTFHCNQDGVHDYPMVQFSCYKDDFFPLYNVSGTSCDNLTGLDADQGANGTVAVYPNPTQNILRVEAIVPANLFELEIISAQGQILKQLTLTGWAELDLSDLKQGIYILTMKTIGKPMVTKKIFKE